MAQWSLHRNPNPATRRDIPYLLDVQSDLLSALGTRAVIPVFTRKAAPARTITRLTPELTVDGEQLVVMTPQLAGIQAKDLGATAGDLRNHRAEILAALDLLITGI